MSLGEAGLIIIFAYIAFAALKWWKSFISQDSQRYLKHNMDRSSVLPPRRETASEEKTAGKDEIADLMQEAEEFIRDPVGGANGADLASRLRFGAIGLGSNRATEFSSDNEKIALLAAKVAFLTFGPNSSKLEEFERAVYYYNAFPSITVGPQYDAFKASL